MDAETLERSVLDRIVPSEEEILSISERANRLKSMVQEYIQDHGIDIDIMFAGSFSKGTFLSNPDLDLFLMFPESVPKKELERIGLQAGEDILHGERMFSEHPYTRGVFEGLDVDMVPCYHLTTTDKLQSAVDRTPFHTAYICRKLSSEQKDQVRLLKKFMKGIGTYGAEQDSRGFSGYLCEVLVVKYGSFRGVLEGAQSWRDGTVIEVEGRGPEMKAPLVVYDPVDPRRNMASSVHIDTMSLFIAAAAAYLRQPDERFFFTPERSPLTVEELGEITSLHGSRLVSVVFERPDVIEDSLYSQLWKTQIAIGKKLDEFSFGVLRAVHSMDDSKMTVVFELERDTLPRTRKHYGPPVWVRSSENFLSRWEGNPNGEPFIEDGRWTVVADRPYTRADEMIRGEASMSGAGRNLDVGTMDVHDHDRTIECIDPLLITKLLVPKMPWE